jgi:dihydrodipicolinate synthase/N-acetylneuraminate lyase
MSAHEFAAPKGVFPAMITPLTADHAIDERVFDAIMASAAQQRHVLAQTVPTGR